MIIDISPLITPDIAVFPGDVRFERSVSMDFKKGDSLSLSSITTTLHLGSHADAPSHYHPEGKSIDECPLETYFGPCQVIDVSHIQGEITKENLGPVDLLAPRILFKTKSIKNIYEWQVNFSTLSSELVQHLSSQKVILIGIDTPSMDHSQSKDLSTHQEFFRTQIAILEGLELGSVDPGVYGLSALPLKIKGVEASPVRAILFKNE